MTTELGSFNKSPLDVFVKSPLDARNDATGRLLVWDADSFLSDETALWVSSLESQLPALSIPFHTSNDWTEDIQDYSSIVVLTPVSRPVWAPNTGQGRWHGSALYIGEHAGFGGSEIIPQLNSLMANLGMALRIEGNAVGPGGGGFTVASTFPHELTVNSNGLRYNLSSTIVGGQLVAAALSNGASPIMRAEEAEGMLVVLAGCANIISVNNMQGGFSVSANNDWLWTNLFAAGLARH